MTQGGHGQGTQVVLTSCGHNLTKPCWATGHPTAACRAPAALGQLPWGNVCILSCRGLWARPLQQLLDKQYCRGGPGRAWHLPM